MAVSVDIEKKLHGFTLKVKLESDGSPMGILGASGSGKSMTLRCIAVVIQLLDGILKSFVYFIRCFTGSFA